jgi:hypothetical protein
LGANRGKELKLSELKKYIIRFDDGTRLEIEATFIESTISGDGMSIEARGANGTIAAFFGKSLSWWLASSETEGPDWVVG